MGFEVKNTSAQSIFREDFTERDFDDPGFKTDTFAFPSPYGTLQATTCNGRSVYVRTDYDKQRIFFARDCLLKNIDAPPTLSQLARAAGLNEFKLKKGFKEIFNQTVFEYLKCTAGDCKK